MERTRSATAGRGLRRMRLDFARRLVQEAAPWTVESCANDSYRLTPGGLPPGIPPYNDEEGGGRGLGSRIQLASALARVMEEV